MTNEELASLGSRRDRLMTVGKALLITATLIWCSMMAFYDTSVNSPGFSDILLTSRTGFIVVDAKLPSFDHRSIWGGPATLFGLQCFAELMGTVAMIALFREWLNRHRVSRLGIALVIVALVGATAATVSTRVDIYPLFISTQTMPKLVDAVDAREPGLMARLKAGERPVLPASGGAMIKGHISRASGRWIADSRLLLVDRADAEGLRFALAQQAFLAHDYATLRRLMPIDLEVPPVDEPARYDIARRLGLMSAAAGVPATTPGSPFPVAAYSASWQTRVAIMPWLRHLMQALLLTGLAATIAALAMRRRYSSIELKMGEVAAAGRRRSLR